MTHAQAVAEGRRLLARSESDQWDLARLTYQELVELARVSISQWARDLGVSETYARQLRDVWHRYGSQRAAGRTNGTFNEYLTRAGVSRERAHELDRQAKETGESVTTVHRKGKDRERRRHTREDILDAERLDRLMEDDEVADAIQRAADRRRARAHEERPANTHDRPSPLAEQLEDVGGQLAELVAALKRSTVTRSEKRDLARAAKTVLKNADWLRTWVRPEQRPPAERSDDPLAEPPAAEEAQPESEPELISVGPPAERSRKRRTRERRSPLEHKSRGDRSSPG